MKKPIYDETKIASDYFANVGANLAKNIPTSSKSPISYMKNFSEWMNISNLIDDELYKAFKSF